MRKLVWSIPPTALALWIVTGLAAGIGDPAPTSVNQPPDGGAAAAPGAALDAAAGAAEHPAPEPPAVRRVVQAAPPIVDLPWPEPADRRRQVLSARPPVPVVIEARNARDGRPIGRFRVTTGAPGFGPRRDGGAGGRAEVDVPSGMPCNFLVEADGFRPAERRQLRHDHGDPAPRVLRLRLDPDPR